MTSIGQGELVLAPAKLEDASRFYDWWNNGRVMAHAGFPKGLGLSMREVEEALLRFERNPGQQLYSIVYQSVPIGECHYRDLEPGSAEIGLKICQERYQNRGLGRQVLSLLIGYLFERGTVKILVDTNQTNASARHLYGLLGFRQVGISENAWIDQVGQWQSTVHYELTKTDFQDLSKESC